jgi:hypothetical protein
VSIPLQYAVNPLWTHAGPRPRRSPFDSAWSTTLDDLDREAHQLGAKLVVIEGSWRTTAVRRDGQLRADVRDPEHPGVVVRLTGTAHGDLAYPCDTFDRWRDNVRAIALALESLRRVDRYGVAGRGEQYRGFAALTAGGPDASRGRALIQQHGSVRAALLATHPDHGGDPAAFADVQAARDATRGDDRD